MHTQAQRPTCPTPNEIAPFIAAVRASMRPSEIWLFGSRARGDYRDDSDWDLLAVLPDDAPEEMTEPLAAWEMARTSPSQVTFLTTKVSDLREIWGLPNTLGYDLAREGVRLVG